MGLLKRLVRKYVHNQDLKETEKEVLEILAQGKDIEARSWRRVASAKRDPEAAKSARKAEEDALLFRQLLADDVSLDVLRDG